MCLEPHDGTVFAVHIDRVVAVRVHGNMAHGADVRERKDVGNGVFIEPDLSEVGKNSDFGGILVSAISNGPQGAATVTDVGEHVWVVENRDRALGIEEDPVGINLVFVLGEHKGVLKKGRAGGRAVGRAGGLGGGDRGRSLGVGGVRWGWAFLGIMPQRLTVEASDVVEHAATSVGDDLCSLGKSCGMVSGRTVARGRNHGWDATGRIGWCLVVYE